MRQGFRGWGYACCPMAPNTRRAARHEVAPLELRRPSRRMHAAVPIPPLAWLLRHLRKPAAACALGSLVKRQESRAPGKPRLPHVRCCAMLACAHAGMRKPTTGLRRCRLPRGALRATRRGWTPEAREWAARLLWTWTSEAANLWPRRWQLHAARGGWRMYHCGHKGVQNRDDGLVLSVRLCEGPAERRLPRRRFSCCAV